MTIRMHWALSYGHLTELGADMIKSHWEEVGQYRDVLPLDIDHARYQAIEAAGMLRILVAIDGAKIAGYLLLIVSRYPRSRQATVAMDDAFYVRPEYRVHGLGRDMLAEAERKMGEDGINFLLWRHKAWRHGGENYLTRSGFEPLETIYGKMLRKPRGEL